MVQPDQSAVPFPRSSEILHGPSPVDSQDTQCILPADAGQATKVTFPGEPWLDFDISSPSVRSFINAELLTPSLDKLSPHLWLVSTPKSDHISPLHAQLFKGRQITITEDPELHLTWMYNHVYIKPLPECLLVWDFWNQWQTRKQGPTSSSTAEYDLAHASALGLVRSYSHLILHASDFRIAKECGLIPANASYAATREFLAHFKHIPDSKVSKRYRFGELRLGRLNFWARIFLRQFVFRQVHVHYNYNEYFTRFYGPLVFLFVFFSTKLSAMQVTLATNSSTEGLSPRFLVFVKVCKWYGVSAVIIAVVILAVLFMLLVFMVLRELVFALRMMAKQRKKASNEAA